jgi:hypothetical protein
MESQAKISGGIGRSRIDDNEWTLFADPDTDPAFFAHMSAPTSNMAPSRPVRMAAPSCWSAPGR